MTYDEIINFEIEFVDNPDFPNLDPKKMMSLPMPEGGKKSPRPGKGLPNFLRQLYMVPLLTKEQELYLFQRMNYVKFLATKLKASLRPSDKGKICAINWSIEEALKIRNLIVESNMRIVVGVAKNHAYKTPRRGDYSSKFESCISDGHIGLIRAVELFDYSRGFTFATYGFNAVKNVMRRGDKAHRKQDSRFKVETDLFTYRTERSNKDFDIMEFEPADTVINLKTEILKSEGDKEAVDKFLSTIGDREREILVARYGLDGAAPMILKEVGDLHGITKERVRQILESILQQFRESHDVVE